MPPKQTYGKRPGTKSTTSYSKFLSPDKDDLITGKPKTKAKLKKPAVTDAVEDIEKDLEALNLGEDNVVVDEVVVKKKGGRKPRKALEHRDANAETHKDDVEKVEKRDAMEEVNKRLENLALREYEETLELKATPKKRGRPRKMREDKDNKDDTGDKAKTKEKSRLGTAHDKQTLGNEEHDEAELLPSTSLRTRKPVLKTKSNHISSPKMPLLPTPEPTPEPNNVYSTYVKPLLSCSYRRRVLSFDEWSSDLEPHCEISKIAEASFSEVYRLTATTSGNNFTQESVLKLIALKTPPNAPLLSQCNSRATRDPARQAKKEMEDRQENDKWKSGVEDVLTEIKLLQNLNYIPGFTNFRELTVLQGRPTTSFTNAWKAWNKSRPRGKKSEFPDPSKKVSYEDTQLWAVIEMQDAGTDCEKLMDAGGIATVWELWDIFWGVCLSVAKAEEACKFEHRDLHLENICIRSSRSDSELTQPVIQEPLKRKLGFTGLETTVIDYTLSRADIINAPPSRQPSLSSSASTISDSSGSSLSEPDVAYLDLNKDAAIFEGDSSDEYQYEIYRYMRGAVFYNNPTQSVPSYDSKGTPRRSPRKSAQLQTVDTGSPRRSPRKGMMKSPCDPPSDIWKQFHPKTNLLWAHFILYKLLEYQQGYEPFNLSSKMIMKNVEADLADAAKVKKKAMKLYKILERVAELLDPEVLGHKDSLSSMKELVVLAMEERWLRVEDVAG